MNKPQTTDLPRHLTSQKPVPILPRLLAVMLCIAMSAGLLFGCSKATVSHSDNGVAFPTMDNSGGAYHDYQLRIDALPTAYNDVSENPAATNSRKVIFNYNYELETTDMSTTLDSLEATVLSRGGYVENARYSGRANNGQYSYAVLTYRLPVDSVADFKETIEASGHVRAKNEQGQDITDEYFDVEAHLNVLQVQEARLLDLLEKSGDLSDLLQIERELARVRTEIELLTGTLQKYDNLVEMTTFTITVYNISEYTATDDDAFGAQVKKAILDSLNIALKALQGLIIFLIYALPYLLVGGLVVFTFTRIMASRKKKRLAAQQNQANFANSPGLVGAVAPAPRPVGAPTPAPTGNTGANLDENVGQPPE